MTFDDEITTVEQLRAVIPHNTGVSSVKVIDRIDDICRRYIAAAPFVVLATRAGDGSMDVSPKGDPAGFVHVLDDRTLAIPDRPGNGRLDSFENILQDPSVALLFIIPGHNDTLRVNGRARIVRDSTLCSRLAHNGREPKLVLIVEVTEALTHCSKCMIRSAMWRPEAWPDRSDVPTLAEALKIHAASDEPVRDMQARIDAAYRDELY